jgi:GNAT superfamily N-acetyltransferase
MSELIIRCTEDKHTEQQTALWLAAFPDDSQEYVENFFAHLPQGTITLVGEWQNELVTMLFLLPAEACIRGECYPVRYLYAGCTCPKYRGRGFYRELMAAAAQKVAEIGENAIYLHPADGKLTETYKRLGYHCGIFRSYTKAGTSRWARTSIAGYEEKRSEIKNVISRNAIFWDVCSDSARFFITDSVFRGASAVCSEDGTCLLYDENVIESIAKEGLHEDENYCLWMPIGDTPLIALMKKFDGITGLVGE